MFEIGAVNVWWYLCCRPQPLDVGCLHLGTARGGLRLLRLLRALPLRLGLYPSQDPRRRLPEVRGLECRLRAPSSIVECYGCRRPAWVAPFAEGAQGPASKAEELSRALPRQLLRDYGIDPDAFMANPSPGPKLTAVLQHLLGEADRRYQQADSGIEKLPKTCRPGIRAARRLYAEIGHKLAAGGYDPITTRAIVTRRRKVGIVAGLFRGSEQLSDDLFAPCARENQFLLAAVPHTEEWQRPTQPRRFSPSASWMLDLFIVLGQRDQITTERQSTDHGGRI